MTTMTTETPHRRRRACCSDCGVQGIHVDTTAGEIVEHGEVTGTISLRLSTALMVDPDGELRCDDCTVVA